MSRKGIRVFVLGTPWDSRPPLEQVKVGGASGGGRGYRGPVRVQCVESGWCEHTLGAVRSMRFYLFL